jgi:hypothetical protein
MGELGPLIRTRGKLKGLLLEAVLDTDSVDTDSLCRQLLLLDDLLGLIDRARACLHDIGNKFDHAEPASYPLQVLQRSFAICLATSPVALPDGTRQPDMADMLATRLECSLRRGTLSVWGPPAVAPFAQRIVLPDSAPLDVCEPRAPHDPGASNGVFCARPGRVRLGVLCTTRARQIGCFVHDPGASE